MQVVSRRWVPRATSNHLLPPPTRHQTGNTRAAQPGAHRGSRSHTARGAGRGLFFARKPLNGSAHTGAAYRHDLAGVSAPPGCRGRGRARQAPPRPTRRQRRYGGPLPRSPNATRLRAAHAGGERSRARASSCPPTGQGPIIGQPTGTQLPHAAGPRLARPTAAGVRRNVRPLHLGASVPWLQQGSGCEGSPQW